MAATKKLTSGQKAAQTRERRAAGRKAAATRKAKGDGRQGRSDTEKE